MAALMEVTFKVFPKPLEYTTFVTSFSTLQQAMDSLIKTTLAPFDLFALDLEPQPDHFDLFLRIGGLPASFPERLKRVKEFFGSGEILEGSQEQSYWDGIREFSWVKKENYLVKVPMTPKKVSQLDHFLDEQSAKRRYSVGANLAWIDWGNSLAQLDQKLIELNLTGLVVLGSPGKVRLGELKSVAFAKRVKTALDPQGRWLEI